MLRKSTVAQLMGGACAAALMAAHPAAAQTADTAETTAVEEVVVTAQKRAETVQTVPMAITAFTGEKLEAQGITSFQGYAVRVPNLSFAYSSSLAATAQAIAIRGIYGRETTGMYLDDTPLPMSVDPRVMDLERIEVLKGPQGTLYGARSMGGTVRLITRQPDATDFSGGLHAVASATNGGKANGSLDGSLNAPLIDGRLAIRVSGYDEYVSGIYDRAPLPGAPVQFARHEGIDAARRSGAAVALQANFLDGALTITPRAMFERKSQSGHPYADYRAGNFTQARLFDLAEPGVDSWNLYSLTARYHTGFGDFTSNTAEFLRHARDQEDTSEVVQLFFGTPATPVLFKVLGRNRTISQELRFTSDFEGPFQLTAGAFYQKTDNLIVFPSVDVGALIPDIYHERAATEITEKALFGEATYDVTDKLRLIAGARWFDNRVAFDGAVGGVAVTPAAFTGTQRQKGINPKFGAQYQATDDVLLYATAAKGFRIGGANSFSDTLCAADLAALGLNAASARYYQSDSLWNYEVGAKTRWLDRRVTLNGAAFDVEWSNIQQGVALNGCGFGISLNGGAARSRGGELELAAAITSALKVNAGVGYTDAEITDPGKNTFVKAGSPIPQVAKWTFNAGIDYRAELIARPVFVHADYAYVGDSVSANNSAANPRKREAYSLVNLRTGMEFDSWTLTLFADNLFDEAANLSDVPPQGIEMPGRQRVAANRPRTLGVDARVRF